jgi:hypothetical protein
MRDLSVVFLAVFLSAVLVGCAPLVSSLEGEREIAKTGQKSVSVEDDYVRLEVLFRDCSDARLLAPITIEVSLINKTDKALAMPRYSDVCGPQRCHIKYGRATELRETPPVYCSLVYPYIIGDERQPKGLRIWGIFGVSYSPIEARDFLVFKPGEKKDYSFFVHPKIVGEAMLCVWCGSWNIADRYRSNLPEGTLIWKGKFKTVSSERFKVSEYEPEHIPERIEYWASGLADVLLDGKEPFSKRSALLEGEFDFRHALGSGYEMLRGTAYEALVLTKALEKLPKSSPFRFLAMYRIIKTVGEGYGFPALERLLGAAEDSSELANVRLLTMDVAKLVIDEDTIRMRTGCNMAEWRISAKLKERARGVLEACAESNDEAVSTRAKYLLQQIAEKEKRQREQEKK